jgi:peptidoglycan pentaglycine glycine transferase (the first glycine)
MQVSEAITSEQARWDAFVAQSPFRSFLHTWAWGELQAEVSVPHYRLVVEDKGKIVAVALVVERSLRLGYSWLYVPRGPLFLEGLSSEDMESAWQALEEKLKGLADEHGSFFVRVDPLWDGFSRHGWRKSFREVQPKHSLILNVAVPEEELLAKMHPKTRYNIRVAERKGVVVRFSSDVQDVHTFLASSRSVTNRTGFSYHPDEYYCGILEVLGKKGMAELAIAEVDGKAVAVHIMIYADGIATYAHGASMNEYRAYMAPALLYWKTILRAKEKGMQLYDFFGVAPEDAPDDHPWAGITRMKTGFGGTRTSYCGAYDLVFNEGLYTMFNITRKAKSIIKSSLSQ